jgi:hypothetical protein
MVRFATDAITGISVTPLLIASFTGWDGFFSSVYSLLGIMGAYLGRIYSPSKGRTLFMIRDIVGGPK